MPIICIDLGHGGTDPGAVSSGLKEKDLTLDIGVKTGSKLEKNNNIKVIYTRWADNQTVSLSKRAEIANYYNADLFLSIHINAGGGTGFESFIHTNASEKSKKAQEDIHKYIAPIFVSNGLPNRGKKTANFQVLRETKMAAVLIECGFIDHVNDSKLLKDNNFINQLVSGIEKGVLEYFKLPKIEKEVTPDYKALYEAVDQKNKELLNILKNISQMTSKY